MDSQNNDIETKYNRIEEMKIEFENKEKRLLKDKQELESYKLQIADQVTTKKWKIIKWINKYFMNWDLLK